MKKAILVVSFGTSHQDTRKVTIDAIENRIREEFKDYEVRKAYTSHMIIKKIKERDGIIVDVPEAALSKLKEEGFSEVIVQPLHVIPGEEYDYIKKVISHKFYDSFDRLVVGRPLLYFKGEEEDVPDDYTVMVHALKEQLPREQAVILMGHGSVHPANSTYACFESVLADEDINNVYMATVEGYPTLERAVKYLKKRDTKEVTLMPFMIVAGDHAKNDMAGEDEDSWKSILEYDGFKVNIYLHGLGENVQVQNIFLQHIKDAVDDKYINLGKTKKGGK
jgi:sirohydrochlorin cobaltochelatase